MATIITDECISCGACVSECPNDAISEGPDRYVIDPARCTECVECVGFFSYEACNAVCAPECCVPDPNHPESEAALFARAQRLHPDRMLALSPSTSRFRR